MSAEVLVMCPACGRPQFPAPACVGCGAALPSAEASPVRPAGDRDRLLAQYQPFLEATLGRGRTALLSDRRFEWKETPDAPPIQIELARVSQVRLDVRPIWEALMFTPLFMGLALTPNGLVRVLGIVLTALSLAACFVQRRYAMEWRVGETRIKFVMGFGRPGTPAVQRIQSVWNSLVAQLLQRRIPVADQA
jgi:hypothetical protein